jgi:putative salt-induced outer membrane protein YdiY
MHAPAMRCRQDSALCGRSGVLLWPRVEPSGGAGNTRGIEAVVMMRAVQSSGMPPSVVLPCVALHGVALSALARLVLGLRAIVLLAIVLAAYASWAAPLCAATHPLAPPPEAASPGLYPSTGDHLELWSWEESPFARSLEELPALLTDPPDLPELVPPDALLVEEPVAPPIPRIWSWRVEVGFNGSDGNSQQMSGRLSARAKRKTKANILTLEVLYQATSADNVLNEHELFHEWRYEELLPNSPWSLFVHGTVEYDEFMAFDVRVTADAGVAYYFVRADSLAFQIRAGSGFSREYGVPGAEYVPEASGGFDLEHKLNRRQRLNIKGDIFPDVRDLSDFRARLEAGWEIRLDASDNDADDHLRLRLSVLDRYDSTPAPNNKPNDVTYSALLVWEY